MHSHLNVKQGQLYVTPYILYNNAGEKCSVPPYRDVLYLRWPNCDTGI